jgi:hypothetical protein
MGRLVGVGAWVGGAIGVSIGVAIGVAIGVSSGITWELINGVASRPLSNVAGVGVAFWLIAPLPTDMPSPMAPSTNSTKTDPKMATEGCHSRISARATSPPIGCGANPARIAMTDPATVRYTPRPMPEIVESD